MSQAAAGRGQAGDWAGTAGPQPRARRAASRSQPLRLAPLRHGKPDFLLVFL